MDRSLTELDNNLVLKKFNLVSKKYLHLGSYGLAKGQDIVVKCLKDFELPMIATGSFKSTNLLDLTPNLSLINASFSEYNILLKNAKAIICMSKFKEGWCRVLHEGAIHGTPILGSGLGGMSELLKIGGYSSSTAEKLRNDFEIRIEERSLSSDKVDLYRSFTLDRFNDAWLFCINELIDEYRN